MNDIILQHGANHGKLSMASILGNLKYKGTSGAIGAKPVVFFSDMCLLFRYEVSVQTSAYTSLSLKSPIKGTGVY